MNLIKPLIKNMSGSYSIEAIKLRIRSNHNLYEFGEMGYEFPHVNTCKCMEMETHGNPCKRM